jgi:hypothetical protein
VVCPAPAVNVVTMISSKDRPKASKPPATKALLINGKVTNRKIHAGFLQVSTKAAISSCDIIEDNNNAECGMAYYDCKEGQFAKEIGKDIIQRDTSDDTWKCNW